MAKRPGLWQALAGPALLGLAALAPACAHGGVGTAAPRRLVVRLSGGEVRDLATMLRLEDRRDLDTVALNALAASAAPEVRRRAYLAAGRIGGPGAAAIARTGLLDADAGARAAAATALGLLRDSAATQALGRVALVEAKGAPAEQAVFALGRMNTAAAHQLVRAVLDAAWGNRPIWSIPERSVGERIRVSVPAAPVLGRALLALWRFPRGPGDAASAARFASLPDTALRWRAAYALMRLADPTTVPDLLRLLRDPYPGVREQAARGLRASVADSAGQRAVAQQALVAALADTSAHVRIQAATALGAYRDAALVAPLAALLRDADGNVAIAAARALGTLRQGGAAAALQALADSVPAPLPLRAAALEGLARAAPPAGVAAVRRWAAAPAWRERYYAAVALGGTRWGDAAPLFEILLHDRDARVVSGALGAMGELLGDSLPPPRPLVFEQLAAPDPFVRAAAIAVLAAHADAGNLQPLLDSYARAAADTADDAAVAAVDALGGLKRAGVPAANAFFSRFQRSADPVVRQHVASALGNDWGPVFPVETGRDVAFYEDVVRRLVAPVLAGAAAPRARIRTGEGTRAGEIVLELAASEAPLTVENLLSLARRRYFDGHRWHRVVPDFVVQDGDPRGDGNGGPGWAIRDELSPESYLRGTLGMALSGADTGGSQFFIGLSPQPHLDGNYTIFGRVVAGWNVLDRVLQDDPIQAIDAVP